jgi:hypothetical protein
MSKLRRWSSTRQSGRFQFGDQAAFLAGDVPAGSLFWEIFSLAKYALARLRISSSISKTLFLRRKSTSSLRGEG